MMSEKVTVADLRAVRLCVKGIRKWFDNNGLNFSDFVQNGMPREDFEKLPDARVKLVLGVKDGKKF